jgi:hypothetical protein
LIGSIVSVDVVTYVFLFASLLDLLAGTAAEKKIAGFV